MTAKSTQEKIAVMQAFADGKPVQCRPRDSSWMAWKTMDPTRHTMWNWATYDYRRIESLVDESVDDEPVSPELPTLGDGDFEVPEKNDAVDKVIPATMIAFANIGNITSEESIVETTELYASPCRAKKDADGFDQVAVPVILNFAKAEDREEIRMLAALMSILGLAADSDEEDAPKEEEEKEMDASTKESDGLPPELRGMLGLIGAHS